MKLFRSARMLVDFSTSAGGPRIGGPLAPQVGTPWNLPPALQPVIAQDVFGLSWLAVSRAEAMSVPALARARNLLCTLIARQPLRNYAGGPDSTTPLDPQPSWIARTDTKQSAFQRMVWTVDDLLFYGLSLWLAERGSDGWPLIAEHVAYEDWTVDDDGRVSIDQVPITDDRRLIIIESFNEGALTYGARAIRMAAGLDRAASDTARAPFKLELHQTTDDTLTDDEIAQLVADARTALAEHMGVLYTNAAVQAIIHSYTADNLLTEGRNYSAIDMARIANVPAAAVDAVLSGSGITYQTGPTLNRSLIDYGAGGFMTAISARLSLNDVTPNGQRIAFDLEQLLDPLANTGTPAGPTSPIGVTNDQAAAGVPAG